MVCLVALDIESEKALVMAPARMEGEGWAMMFKDPEYKAECTIVQRRRDDAQVPRNRSQTHRSQSAIDY